MITNQFVSGDTGSVLQVTCLNDSDSSVIDLTGSTVKLKWEDSVSVLQSKTMTILSPSTLGKAKYQFAATELFPELMYFEIEIIDGAGDIIKNLILIPIRVREKLL